MANRICSIPGCPKAVVGRGWCANHWSRWRKHGDPLGGRPAQAVTKAVDHPDGTRTCSKCLDRKPLEDYDRVKNATLGRRSNCKACRSLDMKRRYEADRERKIEAAREYRRQERERLLALDPGLPARIARDRRERRLERYGKDPSRERALQARKLRIREGRRDPGLSRDALRERDGDACAYCGIEMDFSPRRRSDPFGPARATVDHVIPVSGGGTHTWDNTVLACWSCNASKGRQSLSEWRARTPAAPKSPSRARRPATRPTT